MALSLYGWAGGLSRDTMKGLTCETWRTGWMCRGGGRFSQTAEGLMTLLMEHGPMNHGTSLRQTVRRGISQDESQTFFPKVVPRERGVGGRPTNLFISVTWRRSVVRTHFNASCAGRIRSCVVVTSTSLSSSWKRGSW